MRETPPTSRAEEGQGLDNLPVFSVAEISQALKRTLEGAFARVRVRGEVTGFKRAASGHLYFSLKDESAVLDAVCWRTAVGRLSLTPEDGMEVLCTGRISTYAGRSKYQIVVESLELAGEGALLKLLEERRRMLEAEGLFAPERKKPIPFLPEIIGVVTSPTGAVIRDILHRLDERFPRRVLLWPVLVQGEGAAAEIAAAIEGFNRLVEGEEPAPRPDVLIVARGGGSLEDLWAFNEEAVVRAAAASAIPLISAVGHETDTTLIDFAADLRAPTPTAAAEMAVPVRADLLETLLGQGRRLVGAVGRMLKERGSYVEGLGRGLPDPHALLETASQRFDGAVERLGIAFGNLLARLDDRVERAAGRLRHPRQRIDEAERRLEAESRALEGVVGRLLGEARLRFETLAQLLESCSFERVLERGFALVRDAGGAPVMAAAATETGQDLLVRFHDGEIGARVTAGPGAAGGARGGASKALERNAPGPESPRRKSKGKGARAGKGRDTRQGKLL